MSNSAGSDKDSSKSHDDNQYILDVVESANEFALDLFKTFVIRHKENYVNLFVSPFVIFTSLAKVLIGARGLTEEQLGKVLHLKNFSKHPKNLIHLVRLMRRMFGGNADFVYVASFVYFDSTLTLDAEYKSTLKSFFGTKPKAMDFKDTEVSKLISDINKDIKYGTEGVVDEVVDEQEVSRGVKLLLVNAILFRGYWEQGFDRIPVKKGFTYIGHEGVRQQFPVDMMTKTSIYKYCTIDSLTAQVVLLPYENSDLAMVVVLPQTPGDDGVDMIRKMDYTTFLTVMSAFTYEKVTVTLPMFALDPNKISIKGTLETMGAKSFFQAGVADFGGITTTKPIHLSKIAHKAFILVDNKGSEAAPPILKRESLAELERSGVPKTFEADHPFAFMIIDVKKKLIMMMGYFGDPRETMEVVHDEDITPAEREELLADMREFR